jgi:hypothetical protein
MRVLGKTMSGEAYRLGLRIDGTDIVALIPEALLSAEHGHTARVPHQAAYEWIETAGHPARPRDPRPAYRRAPPRALRPDHARTRDLTRDTKGEPRPCPPRS